MKAKSKEKIVLAVKVVKDNVPKKKTHLCKEFYRGNDLQDC